MEKHNRINTTKELRAEHRKPGVTIAQAKAGDTIAPDSDLVDWDKIRQTPGGIAPQTDVQKSFCADDKCKDTLKCALVPYNGFCCPVAQKGPPKVESQTPHHIVQAHCFLEVGGRSEGEGATYKHVDKYKHNEAPCICLDGAGKVKEHGDVHDYADAFEQEAMDKEEIKYKIGKKKGQVREVKYTAKSWDFATANDKGSEAVAKVRTECKKECLKQQSEAGHQKMMGDQIKPDTPLRADPHGTAPAGWVPKSTTPAVTPP